MRIPHVKQIAWMLSVLLLLSACHKNKVKCTGDSEKDFQLTGFNKLKVSDQIHVYVTRSNSFSVKAKGCAESINDLNIAVGTGGILSINYGTSNLVHKSIDIIITMPALLAVDASGATEVQISGMEAQTTYLRVVLSSAAECSVSGAPFEMLFNLSGASKMEITGSADLLSGDISGASKLRAYGLASKHTDITASGASDAYVTASEKLYAEASGASTIRYKGNPTTISKNTSGSSRIIKE
jgi:hypothetical protein